jgi:intraflagellar transport protein 80
MVVPACLDGKDLYTAVDGGSIAKYPVNLDHLTQTTDDIFTLNQSPIACLDSTRDAGAPNTFIIGCADGNLHLYSPNGRVKKSVPTHTGGVTCVSVNSDEVSIASDGEDGVAKIWSRNGILCTNPASVGGAVMSCNWDNTAKYLMFTYGGTVTGRSTSFKRDQTQFRAHRRLVTFSAWNGTS